MTEQALFDRARKLHVESAIQPVLTPETSHFGCRTGAPDTDASGVHSTRSRRWLPWSVVGAVLAVWVTSAWRGAEYLTRSFEAVSLERKLGWPVALTVFAVSTTVIWLGLVVLTLVVAWKKWSESHAGSADGPDHASPQR